MSEPLFRRCCDSVTHQQEGEQLEDDSLKVGPAEPITDKCLDWHPGLVWYEPVTADDWDTKHWDKPVDASKRLSLTDHIAEIMCRDAGKKWDDLSDGQEFYLMVQATMMLDDWFDTDLAAIGEETP